MGKKGHTWAGAAGRAVEANSADDAASDSEDAAGDKTVGYGRRGSLRRRSPAKTKVSAPAPTASSNLSDSQPDKSAMETRGRLPIPEPRSTPSKSVGSVAGDERKTASTSKPKRTKAALKGKAKADDVEPSTVESSGSGKKKGGSKRVPSA
jgi:hypothetical protein